MNQMLSFNQLDSGLTVKFPSYQDKFETDESLVMHDIMHPEIIKYLGLNIEPLSLEEESIIFAVQLLFDEDLKNILQVKFEHVLPDYDESKVQTNGERYLLRFLRSIGSDSQNFDLILDIYRLTIELTRILEKLNIVNLYNLQTKLKNLKSQILTNESVNVVPGEIAGRSIQEENLDKNQLVQNLRDQIQQKIYTIQKRKVVDKL
jgi:hypothetical protein